MTPDDARAPAALARDWVPWALPAVWVALWCWGWPRPHVDDLFFTGTAVGLVRDGRLANPWTGHWMDSFGTTLYLVHPPFFPYVLAAWIRMFGVGAGAFTAFHCAIQAASATLLYAGLRRGGVSRGAAAAGALALSIMLGECGMRPDALAVLLVLIAQFLVARAGAGRWIAGSFLAASAVLVQSFAATLVVPLQLLHGLRLLRRGEAGAGRLTAWTFTGIAAAALLFVAALPASVPEFLRVFLLHSRFVTPPLSGGPYLFWKGLTFGWELPRLGPVWLILALAAVFAWRRGSSAASMKPWWTAYAAFMLLGICLYATYTIRYADYLGLLLAAATWGMVPGAAARRLGIAAVLAGCLLQNAIVLIGQFHRRETPDAAAIRAVVAAHPGKRLLIDDIAARFVYDFDLPPGAADFMSRRPIAQGYRGRLADKPADEIWIASEWKAEHYLPDSGVRAKRMRLGSITVEALDWEPYRVRVFP